eukprot:COSAG02_NODE_724_length_18036_cov_162.971511_3_plen_81_part_00
MIYLMGSPKPFLLSQITFGFIKSNHLNLWLYSRNRASGSDLCLILFCDTVIREKPSEVPLFFPFKTCKNFVRFDCLSNEN